MFRPSGGPEIDVTVAASPPLVEVEVMGGQTDFFGRLIETTKTPPIDFYETWHAQNIQKHNVARKWTGDLHALTSEYSALHTVAPSAKQAQLMPEQSA